MCLCADTCPTSKTQLFHIQNATLQHLGTRRSIFLKVSETECVMDSYSSSMLCLQWRGSVISCIKKSVFFFWKSRSLHRTWNQSTVSHLRSLHEDGVVAVTFDIHFTTSGQSRRDGLGVHFNQLNYASAPYLRCQNCKGKLLRGIESSSFLGANSNGLAIVLLIQSSFYQLPSTNGFSVLLIQSSLPSLHPTNGFSSLLI